MQGRRELGWDRVGEMGVVAGYRDGGGGRVQRWGWWQGTEMELMHYRRENGKVIELPLFSWQPLRAACRSTYRPGTDNSDICRQSSYLASFLVFSPC
ncbi:hypothetical protein BaRGS_00026490 [Batillaria attramentaria]|uniref:Uncharacterized protein n=1 Tax=Batillaria attramentaria TaxID=370345 RepID=A0ABD0K594_9CAEN